MAMTTNKLSYLQPPQVENKKNKFVIPKVNEDFNVLADKLGVNVLDLQRANPDTDRVVAGAALNVPHMASPPQDPDDKFGVKAKRAWNAITGKSGEEFHDVIMEDFPPRDPADVFEAGQNTIQKWLEWIRDNTYGRTDETGYLPQGVGQGAGVGLSGKNASPAYNPPPTDPREGVIEGGAYDYANVSDPRELTIEEGVYGDTSQPIPKKDIWEGHNYWEGHIDPYRLALGLAKQEGVNLPPHPSERINDYMWSGDFARNYLRDIRAWEDSVYGGQRASMVDIIRNDEVLYSKLMNDQLTTGDLLEIHRELPALAEELYGGMENFPITDQATYDILGKLGYIPDYGSGYGGYPSYSSPSYSGGGGSGSAPRRNTYPSQLMLDSWSI